MSASYEVTVRVELMRSNPGVGDYKATCLTLGPLNNTFLLNVLSTSKISGACELRRKAFLSSRPVNLIIFNLANRCR